MIKLVLTIVSLGNGITENSACVVRNVDVRHVLLIDPIRTRLLQNRHFYSKMGIVISFFLIMLCVLTSFFTAVTPVSVILVHMTPDSAMNVGIYSA